MPDATRSRVSEEEDSPVIPFRLESVWYPRPIDVARDGLPNSLEPGKRPPTTLSPTLVLRNGEPYLAFGTPGGDKQDQWTLLFFLYHTEFGSDLQQAADGPTFHSDHVWTSFAPRSRTTGVLTMEDPYEDCVTARLQKQGHTLDLAEPWSAGWTTAVARDASGSSKFPQGLRVLRDRTLKEPSGRDAIFRSTGWPLLFTMSASSRSPRRVVRLRRLLRPRGCGQRCSSAR